MGLPVMKYTVLTNSGLYAGMNFEVKGSKVITAMHLPTSCS